MKFSLLSKMALVLLVSATNAIPSLSKPPFAEPSSHCCTKCVTSTTKKVLGSPTAIAVAKAVEDSVGGAEGLNVDSVHTPVTG
jgi:hypothetical protein